MRTATPALKLLALSAVAVALVACGGDKAPAVDETAMAPAPAPTPDSYAVAADDGSWSVSITPQNIIYMQKRGARTDSMVFDFKVPTVNGAISEYEVVRTMPDTSRITIALARTACTDKAGASYTHKAQLYISGKRTVQGTGCARLQ